MAFNTTDFDYEATLGLSPKQIVVTGLLLTGLKSSTRGFFLRTVLATCINCLLGGWVYCELFAYVKEYPRDLRGYQILVAILFAGTFTGQIIGIVDIAMIVRHPWDFGAIFEFDTRLEITKMLLNFMILGPTMTLFFTLRAWSLHARNSIVTVICVVLVLAQTGAGVAVGVIGYSLPYRFSETLDMADLALVPIWGDKLEATWRVWAIIWLASNFIIGSTIFGTLMRFRGKHPEINIFVNALARNLAESMLPALINTLIFCIAAITNQGGGGILRFNAEIAAPFFMWAVLHSLRSRHTMRALLETIAPGAAQGMLTREYPMMTRVSGTTTTGMVDVDQDFKGDGEAGQRNSISSAENLRTLVRKYYSAWEDPINVVYRKPKYDFKLGTREIAVERDDF